jgi:hypothetical protein
MRTKDRAATCIARLTNGSFAVYKEDRVRGDELVGAEGIEP